MKDSERKLERYNEMRDFTSTEEPTGRVRPSTSRRSFVVQKHAARRLHYDFRLEHEGVLWSWAVPKGPSLSPKDKRLAVQTEDHPVDYRDFEGTIPEGEYGGGAVIVWDRGTWEPLGDPAAMMKKGRIEFSLSGDKLRGNYMLVRLKDGDRGPRGDAGRGKTNWLLFKRDDEEARAGADADVVTRQPRSVLTGRSIEDVERGVPAGRSPSVKNLPAFGEVAPQLATLVDRVPLRTPTAPWVYEMKYDGYRILARLDGGAVRLASRNGKEWTERFPGVAEALSHVRAKTALFDGEIAWVADDGRTDFQKLQNALGDRRDEGRIVYFVFDLLHYDGVDLRPEPLSVRKDRLRTILAGEGPPLRMSEHVELDGEAFFRAACKSGLEGIIAKRADRPYRAGRGTDWVKVKCQKRQEMVIVGFTPPKGKRVGIGALLLGVREPKGELRYAGKVGTGFTHASLVDLQRRLSKIVVDAPPVTGAPRMRNATWVAPKLVGQVRFTEWTRDGALRHPAFEGLRSDKAPADVVREREQHVPASDDGEVRVAGVRVTNPGRVLDEESGVTKADLVRHYAAVADRLLPYAKKRPLMLVRCPEGVPRGRGRSSCFVQKHMGRGLTADLERSSVDGEEVLFVTRAAQIVELAQFNAVELHGWGCRAPRFDRPDWIVFDLDPDEGLPFGRVVDAAETLREELARLDLETFVKTTGGKGLHVVVPLGAKQDWATVRAFAELVARGMAKRAPHEYVATMSKAARRGKIFVDYLRNAQGATAILPYAARARPGMAVAIPVAWKDLRHVDPRAFTVRTAAAHLAKQRTDPWRDLLATKQTLSKRVVEAVERFGEGE